MEYSDKRFIRFFLGSWSSFVVFAIFVYGFSLYIKAPFVGLLGYATMIVFLLFALSESKRRLHYLLVSVSLMFFGAMASFDLVYSKEELTYLWRDWLHEDITSQQVDGFVQSLLILISIFTGSLASGCLFYGLNKRNFPRD